MSKYCPFCGEELVDHAKFCKSCGKDVSQYDSIGGSNNINNDYQLPVVEKNHTVAVVAGFISALIFQPLAIIIAVYLITRKDSTKAKKYAIIIILVAVLVYILNFITFYL